MNGLIPTERKAVAPIIATLLMVAIAVVGGILIFVFTQGFFTETETGSQSKDKIEIVGYDLRDSDDLDDHQDHTGAGLEAVTSGTVGGALEANDFAIVYVTNPSDTSIILRSIELGGSSYVYFGESAATDITGAYPGDGKFVVCTITLCTTEPSFTDAVATILPGATVTVIMEVDAQQVDLKNGRNTKITVETDNGGIATIGAKVGKQRGS